MADQTEIPTYPHKLSRDERRVEKERDKAFQQELKRQAKGTGWKVARGTLFKREADWFVSNVPTLAFKRGVVIQWSIKPMAIDPLFWQIVGLEENNKLPLSFRGSGAWTVRPISQRTYTSKDVEDPRTLAADILAWSGNKLEEVEHYSLEQMLAEFEPLDTTTSMKRTNAICLLLLLKRFDEALDLCGMQDDTRCVFSRESGGFVYGNKTFIDGARSWIQENKGGG